MEEVYRFLKENIDINKQYIVVGVSGGADSMVLLHLLEKFLETSSCRIVCAHVHHNLRKESDEEQEFVKNYCLSHHILFETTKLEYEEKFTEKIGREKRYKFFEEILKKYQASYLFLAHHGDDLVETILMKLSRGTSLWGACGIELQSKREFYTIVRPLLFCTKAQLYEYTKKQEIPYVEDKSNQDIHYTRNRYRQTLLPFLKQENPNVHKRYLSFSQDLEEVLDYVENDIEREYQKVVKKQELNWKLWLSLHPFLQKEILKKFLFSIYQENIILVTKSHLESFYQFLKEGKINSRISFPLNYEGIKTYQVLIFVSKEEIPDYQILLDHSALLPNHHRIEQIESTEENSNFITRLDSSMVTFPLFVRNVRPGDTLEVKNMKGHKKVSDIFTDEKVSFQERKRWPVVVDSTGEIIWLPGLKKTQFDRKKDGFYDIILKYY